MDIVLSVTEGPHAGREFVFDVHDTFVVGRGSASHFRLPAKDPYFSRLHFMVEFNPPNCRLLDLESLNGTYVNGERVTHADLGHGDLIEGGDTIFQVTIRPGRDAGKTLQPGQLENLEQLADDDISAAETLPPRKRSNQIPRRPITSTVAPPADDSSATDDSEVSPSHSQSAQAADNTVHDNDPPADAADIARSLNRPAVKIPGFRIVRELARGGMGIVYLAIEDVSGDQVAIKTVQPAYIASQHDVERFLREAEILRKLEHPYIVRYRTSGEVDGLLYFSMEYVDGPDTRRLIKTRGKPLPIGRAVQIACQLLEALAYAHGEGFVHRDIKPENVILSSSGDRNIVKLTDFGLARVYQASRLSGLTMCDSIGGTPAFMAPDQILNFRQAAPAADQFSAAATLYYLLTIRYVHDFPRNLHRQILMILQDEATPIRKHRPEIPQKLAVIIRRALSKDPEKRYPDVSALRDALLPFAAED